MGGLNRQHIISFAILQSGTLQLTGNLVAESSGVQQNHMVSVLCQQTKVAISYFKPTVPVHHKHHQDSWNQPEAEPPVSDLHWSPLTTRSILWKRWPFWTWRTLHPGKPSKCIIKHHKIQTINFKQTPTVWSCLNRSRSGSQEDGLHGATRVLQSRCLPTLFVNCAPATFPARAHRPAPACLQKCWWGK